MDDLIICVAPYPGEKQEEKFPGRMDLVDEVVRCHGAGASTAHLHVRDGNGLQTTDTSLFARVIEEIHSRSPMIIEGSTGGTPEHRLEERCVSFTVPGVEMGSLNLGSVNLWDGVYNNKRADMEYYAGELLRHGLKPFLDCFDLSHFSNLENLRKGQLVSPPFVFGLVFDVPNALPYTDRHLDIFLEEMPGDSIWFLARHHAHGYKSFLRALERGGHVRVGYEDGPFLSDGRRALSNADLVEEVAKAAQLVGRKVVDPARAREIMGIRGS